MNRTRSNRQAWGAAMLRKSHTRRRTRRHWIVFTVAIAIAGGALWPKYIIEYVLAFTLGIAFQYFSITPMRDLGVREGIIAALKADTLSLTAFEVRMFGWMA